jgi:hypothetical protein
MLFATHSLIDSVCKCVVRLSEDSLADNDADDCTVNVYAFSECVCQCEWVCCRRNPPSWGDVDAMGWGICSGLEAEAEVEAAVQTEVAEARRNHGGQGGLQELEMAREGGGMGRACAHAAY